MGWPEETPEYNYFYPTNVLVTGYDIITFWVSRMIFSALAYTGKKPFTDVVIHGLVRDALGRKMSKSLGNGIDPLEIIDTYGADALRLALVTGISAGNDTRFTDEKVTSCRNFANKLWNAARFVLMNLPEDFNETELPEELALEDKWLLSQYNDLVKAATENIENYDIGVAEQKIVDFIWRDEIIDKLLQKHAVTQEEVTEVFDSKPLIQRIEKGERPGEDVYAAYGRSAAGRYLAVFFLYKKEQRALIVSARQMTQRERQKYERR
jgi:valyl-tRNA synthetase